jgi:NADH dehydrogenase [ubiquinone] 1 alpha subcomplex assembly factor 6
MIILSRSLCEDREKAAMPGPSIHETRRPDRRSGATEVDAAPMALVRRHDRDRFQTALFAPPRQRQALFALYAFNYEVARVREIVTEPMLGQIRLQWWREAIAAAFAGNASRRHEIVLPLTAAIRDFGLSREPFDRLIDTRERDLADAPPETMAALGAYAEGTSANLVVLALEILEVRAAEAAAAARGVGIGYALAGLIRALPFHATAGRSYLPADVAARHGIDPREYETRRAGAGLRVAVAEIAAAAQQQLNAARRQRGAVPRAALPAMLPAVVASRFLGRLERAGYDPFDPRLAVPDTLQSWRLSAAALLNRW